jgi:hypothetical protein
MPVILIDAVSLALCGFPSVLTCTVSQGGPDSTDVKHDLTFNQWEDLDDSPVSWNITEVFFDSCSPWHACRRWQTALSSAGDLHHEISRTIVRQRVNGPGMRRAFSVPCLTKPSIHVQPVDPLEVDPWLSAVGGGLYKARPFRL